MISIDKTTKTHLMEIIPDQQYGNYSIYCPKDDAHLQLIKEPNYCPMCGEKVDFGDAA